MSTAMTHQKDAVDSGYWPLYRFDPNATEHHMQLDSKAPSVPLKTFTQKEVRFAMLARSDPERAAELMLKAEAQVLARRHRYEQMAAIDDSQEVDR
jgi:pyruvate-ferredoxin/flavodoxin oxidoreductase